MDTKSEIMNNIQIASPCSVSWEDMTGNERVRFCAHCKLHVYNLSSMNKHEAVSLMLSTENRICVRFYRRADGTILTRDCRIGLMVVRETTKRILMKFAAVFGIALTGLSTGACIMGARPRQEVRQTQADSNSAIELKNRTNSSSSKPSR
jgi:hypothetical protein